MSSNLTKIQGIGPSAAAQLAEAGFETIESIASATPSELGKVSGFGLARSQRTIAAAQKITETVSPDTNVVSPDTTTKTETKTETAVMNEAAVSPVVAASGNSRFRAMREPTVLIPVVAFVVLSVMAFGKSDTGSSLFNSISSTSESIVAEYNALMSTTPDIPIANENVTLKGDEAHVGEQTTSTVTAKSPGVDTSAPVTQQAETGYYPGHGYQAYAPWSNQYAGNGNAWGNGNAGFSMNFNGRSNVAGQGVGQGYGYNNPYYYGAPYGYAPYGYAYPVSSYQALATPEATR